MPAAGSAMSGPCEVVIILGNIKSAIGIVEDIGVCV